jgi:hypothetical protein
MSHPIPLRYPDHQDDPILSLLDALRTYRIQETAQYPPIPLYHVLTDQGITRQQMPNYIAKKVGYLSGKFVSRVLFQHKPISLDLKHRWAEALGLDLETAFPEEKERLRYLPPTQIHPHHARLAALLLSLTAHFHAILQEIAPPHATDILLGQTPDDAHLLPGLMHHLISAKALTNDIEHTLRALGVDTDQTYRQIKASHTTHPPQQ